MKKAEKAKKGIISEESKKLSVNFKVNQRIFKSVEFNKGIYKQGTIKSKVVSNGDYHYCLVAWENNLSLLIPEHYSAIMLVPKDYKTIVKKTKTTPSSQKLVDALMELDNLDLKQIIDKAKNNQYDDFECNHPAPKNLLMNDLNQVGFNDDHPIVLMIKAGEFDASLEEGEKWAEENPLSSILS
ncbi:MAG: hypothetical protein WBF90_33825 [Rivularia sp. (in: cyanobacteria)]